MTERWLAGHYQPTMSQRVQRGFRIERLRELREAAGMTMTDLARLSELSPSTIFELGTR